MGQLACGTKTPKHQTKLTAMINKTFEEVIQIKSTIEKSDDRFTLTKVTLMRNFKFSADEATEIFNRFDTNQLGYIDSYEFLCGCILMSTASFELKAKTLFQLYDNDRSNLLSLDELMVLMQNALSCLLKLDGREPPSIGEVADRTRAYFKATDADNDQKINFNEFKTYLKQDKLILTAITGSGVVSLGELGTDFGSGSAPGCPDLDTDLENECRPAALFRDAAKVEKKVEAVKAAERGEFEEEDLGEGDQFMSTRQSYPAPDGYKPPKGKQSEPVENLELEYIYGYRCHDTRNNLRYTADGKIVYHAAAVGIVLDQSTNTQRHFLSHRDDIHCLAINPAGTLCVTGEIGPKPRLCLWNCETMEELQCLTMPLTKGIQHVTWSKDGQFIGASDMSDDHSIAIFQLKPSTTQMTLIAKGKGCRANIMSLGFSPDAMCLVATCVKSVAFFTWANGQIKGIRGTGWGQQPADTILCQAWVGNQLFTGNFAGEIISWMGSAINKRVKAHSLKINAMYATASGQLITGSADGTVQVWSVNGVSGGQIAQAKIMNLKRPKLLGITPHVISVCEANGVYLVGTRGGEIIEIDQQDNARVLMKSHSNEELWGLAVHPTLQKVATWDGAGQLCFWDIKSHKQLQSMVLETGGQSLAYSNNGKHLAIGFSNGNITVLDETYNVLAERKDRAGKAISVLKYAPKDDVLVSGAHDQFILTYSVANNYKPLQKFKGHSSTVKFIDFTLDGLSFQSLCQAYETLYFSVETGKQNTRGASQFKNETWATYTHPLGWGVQGIWPAASDGSDINMVDRHPDGTIIASADDFGTVKLFKYPSPVAKSPHNTYFGHSAHVTNIQFTRSKQGPQYIITTGGGDKCVFQWKYNKTQTQKSSDSNSQTFEQKNVLKAHLITQKRKDVQSTGDFHQAEDQDAEEGQNLAVDDFAEEDLGEGDQALANRGPDGNVLAMQPTNFKAPNPRKAVATSMELKWVFGFRNFDTRNNLKFNNLGQVVYCTAGVGVVQNVQEQTQRHFNGHRDDIVALAYHPGLNLVATGQMASKELNEQSAKVNKKAIDGKLVNIFLWDAETCQQKGAPIFGLHRRAVRQLAFSPDGKRLLSIGEDDQHAIGIYDVQSRALVVKSQVGPDQVLDATWNQNGDQIAVITIKTFELFQMQGEGKTATLQNINCAVSKLPQGTINKTVGYVLGGMKLVSGTSQGKLITWNGTSHGKIYEAHKGALNCFYPVSETEFYSCGDDGVILSWDATYQLKIVIDLKLHRIQQFGITAVDVSGNKLLVGTAGSSILQFENASAAPVVVNQGHFKGQPRTGTYNEIWACTTHPTQQLFATGGADSMVRIWSSTKQEYCSQRLLNDPTSLDWSNDAKWIAVGDREATISILDAKSLKVVDFCKNGVSAAKAEQMKGKHNFKTEQWIECCRVSPQNNKVAFGNHGYDHRIQVVLFDSAGKITTKPPILSKMLDFAPTNVDWSQDGQTIVTGGTMIFSLQDNKLVHIARVSSYKDTLWQTWSSWKGFLVQGITGDLNALERSRNNLIVATGDDSGQVNLHNWPCVDKSAKSAQYYGHSAHVTKVKFSADDDYLISTGGGDMTVFVWDTDFKSNPKVPEYEPHPDDQEEVNHKEDLSKSSKIKFKEEQHQKRLEEQKSHLGLRNKSTVADSEFEEIDVGAGDEFLAVVPWKGQIKPPSNFKRAAKDATLAPDLRIELEWVHGYRGSNSRNNLQYVADNQMVYYAAGVCVKYDPVSHTQSHFTEHHDDVTVISYHSNKRWFATGENGKKPSVFVVDSTTMQKVVELKGNGIQNTVIAIEFSPSGNLLAIICGDDQHNAAVYRTSDWKLIAQDKTDRSTIFDMAFQNDTEFVTTGPKHFKSYTITAEGKFRGKLGNFAGLDQRIACCQFNGSECLTGNINGDLYKWSGTQASVCIAKLHERIIDSIMVGAEYIFTGSRDCKLKILSKTYALLVTIDLKTLSLNSISPEIRAIDMNAAKDKLVIGTFGHEVIEIPVDVPTKKVGEAQVLIHGHYAPMTKLTNEVWGLCPLQSRRQYVTVSDDATLRVWDTDSRKQVSLISLQVDKDGKEVKKNEKTGDINLLAQARAVDIDKSEEYLALGMRDGSLRVFKAAAEYPYWKEIASCKCQHAKVPGEWIEDLKFSPDGQYLVVTSHNNWLYLFEVPKFSKPVRYFSKSSSFITHVDWSLDSQAIRTNDASYELMYYTVGDGKQQPSGASGYRDEEWSTNSCVLSWATQGIWQAGYDGTDINHADRSNRPLSNGQRVLATADDRGLVRVYKYPSPVDSPAKSVDGKGHSSHVTKVRFSADDEYLYTVGGNDTTVMQWKVTPQ